MKVGGKFAPLFGIDGPDFGDALGGVAQCGAEGIFGHGRARKAHNGVTRAQPMVNRQVVHRGNDFALGEVS